ncbi:leucine-rich repeat-containing protein 72 [Podarcis lilfordi]|uniref:Leucine-rich repeat-containing protein 72 n=1 Tax=Podarcis lilfordi TaxID=74358 RepID=A0AA35L3A0_9SAUR|nr:leucine-rich repeat-containing protein 72 [Podarcis lilfordi]
MMHPASSLRERSLRKPGEPQCINAEAAEALGKQLKICGYKKNNEVTDLYLGEKGLKEIPDLSQFRILSHLWLNNNKIQNLTMLKHNCCLTELYLNNNEIRDISGALKHIHVLQVLMLHNNHLKTLEKTVKELQGMQHLQTLNLFNNPMSHDRRYHLYVIYHIPSVTLFDRKGCEFGNHLVKIPYENPEHAVLVRAMRRSVMEFATVDWEKMPTCEEKRLGSNPEKRPERLTIKFR